MANGNGTAIVRVDVRELAHGKDTDIETYDGRTVLANIEIARALLPCGQNASDMELGAFLAFCQANRLDPFRKQCHLVKYNRNEPAAWVVSYWVYVDRAQRHPQFDGLASGVIWRVEGETIRGKPCDYARDDTHQIVGGWATAWRKDRAHPFEVEVPAEEMVKTKRDGTVTRFWKTMTTTMMEKVPISRVLRLAFADELGHTYTDAEPAIPAPEYSPSATDVPTREEREAEPTAAPAIEEAPIQKVKAAILVALGRLELEADDAFVAELMPKVAARATGQDRESFAKARTWTDGVAIACIEILKDHGIDPEWLPAEVQHEPV